jgi:hypothetical protein
MKSWIRIRILICWIRIRIGIGSTPLKHSGLTEDSNGNPLVGTHLLRVHLLLCWIVRIAPLAAATQLMLG